MYKRQVVSAAAGATGSMAGQIAKLRGCKVIGIVGSDEKAQLIVDEFGFDAAINYKTDDITAAVAALAPEGADIYFDNVSFSYDNNKPSLKNITLSIKQGETVALVGSTGSGKTTLVNLLTRFYSPTEGKIAINNEDINSFDLESYRSNFSFVDQNVRLFNDTISGNIAFGQKDKMPMDSIINAANVSNSIEFIEKLDNKFDSDIGEDGVTLSGGQRQRLSIARAIAKDSAILILDEATSALDSATEKLVQSAITKMQKGRTTIIIAHRLSTIQNADRIIVLKEGAIIEQGSHKELIKASGEYAKLNQQQL